MLKNISDIFWNKLKALYDKEGIVQPTYDEEKPILENVFAEIENLDDFKEVYAFDEPIGVGGAGVVVKIKDTRLNLFRALKIPRPKEDNLISVKSEIEHLKEIRHENIIGLHALGEVTTVDFTLPYPFFIRG
jgi:hypothetical protein